MSGPILPATDSCDSTYIVTFLTNNTGGQAARMNFSASGFNSDPINSTTPPPGQTPGPGYPEGQFPWQIASSNWSQLFNAKGGPGLGTSFQYQGPAVSGQPTPLLPAPAWNNNLPVAGYSSAGVAGWQTWGPSSYPFNVSSDLGPQLTFLTQLQAAKAAGKKILVSLGGFNCMYSILTDGDTLGATTAGNTQTAEDLAAALVYWLCGDPLGTAETYLNSRPCGLNLYNNFTVHFADPSGNVILFDGIDIDIEHGQWLQQPNSSTLSANPNPPLSATDFGDFVAYLRSQGGANLVITAAPAAPQLNQSPLGSPPTSAFKNLAQQGNPVAEGTGQPAVADITSAILTPASATEGPFNQSVFGSLFTALNIQWQNAGYGWFLDQQGSPPTPVQTSFQQFVSQLGQWVQLLITASSTTKINIGFSNGGQTPPPNQTTFIVGEARGVNFFNTDGNPVPFPTLTTQGDATYLGLAIKQAVLEVATGLSFTGGNPQLGWFGGCMTYCLPDTNVQPDAKFARTVTSITGGTLTAYDGANSGDLSVTFGPGGTYIPEANTDLPQTVQIAITGVSGSDIVVVGNTVYTPSSLPTSVLEGQNFIIQTQNPITQVQVGTTSPQFTNFSIVQKREGSDIVACMISFPYLPQGSWTAPIPITVTTSAFDTDAQADFNNSITARPAPIRFKAAQTTPLSTLLGIVLGIGIPLALLLFLVR